MPPDKPEHAAKETATSRLRRFGTWFLRGLKETRLGRIAVRAVYNLACLLILAIGLRIAHGILVTIPPDPLTPTVTRVRDIVLDSAYGCLLALYLLFTISEVYSILREK